MTRATASSLRLSVIAMAITLFVGLAFAAVASADDMGGMNMTPEEMQNMPQSTPSATAPAMDMSGQTDGHGGMADMPGMDGSGGSANWLVVGGAVALIAGGTAAAVVIKRRLRTKMLAGALATEGVRDA